MQWVVDPLNKSPALDAEVVWGEAFTNFTTWAASSQGCVFSLWERKPSFLITMLAWKKHLFFKGILGFLFLSYHTFSKGCEHSSSAPVQSQSLARESAKKCHAEMKQSPWNDVNGHCSHGTAKFWVLKYSCSNRRRCEKCRSALDEKGIWALKSLHMPPVDQRLFPCHAAQYAQGARSNSELAALEKQALLCTTVMEEALWMQSSKATSVQALPFSTENRSVLCAYRNPS